MPQSNQNTAFDYSVQQPVANVQVFTSSGIWTKPAGISFVQVCLWGGGGGGGSGSLGSLSCPGQHGGAGGGGGARNSVPLIASAVPQYVTVTIGAGGTGGAAVTVSCTRNAGTGGGTTSFGSFALAYGGAGGAGGNTSQVLGGGGGGSASSGTATRGGQPWAAQGSTFFAIGTAGAGAETTGTGSAEWGGGGAARTVAPSTGNGGAGGGSVWGGAAGGNGGGAVSATARSGGAGGTSGYTTGGGGSGGSGNTGGNASAGGNGATNLNGSGSGGGGGGAVTNLSNSAGAGGNGGFPAGGGGGGGSGPGGGYNIRQRRVWRSGQSRGLLLVTPTERMHMCAAAEPEKRDTLNANLYFPTVIYTIEKPEFIEAVNRIAEEELVEVRKKAPLNEIYPVHMTGNLYDKPDIIPFQYYVGQTAYNILNEQGYNLAGFEPYFSEMWCQEHFKHSGMDQHTHGAGSQIVGFYFLEVPENGSRVVFHDPRAGKPLISWAEQDPTKATFASNMINFEAKPGMLMFTNAWLPHSFTRNESDKPMKFVHFNLGLRPAQPVFNACPAPAAEII